MPHAPQLHVAVAARAAAPQHGHGGLERAVTAHIRALARHDVRLTVFTQPPDPDQPPPDDCDGMVIWRPVPYRRYPIRRNSIPDRLVHYAAFARRLGAEIAELAGRERVDIVHAHGLAGLGYAERLRARGDGLPPLVLNPHGLEEFNRGNRAKWLAYAPFRRGLRRTAHAAAAVIATDRALLDPLRQHLHLPYGRLALIPNGVELAVLDALVESSLARDLGARFGLDRASLTLVSVARLEHNKGLDLGVAALAQLGSRLPADWRWLIIGRGTMEQALREMIARRGLGERITLAGALTDTETQSLLARADLCLVPSRYEGSSLTALEALAHRVPVVATPVGGLPDKILPGETGFLANAPDADAFAAAMGEALTARDSWLDYGARARALVDRTFSWDALGEQYIARYRALAGRTA